VAEDAKFLSSNAPLGGHLIQSNFYFAISRGSVAENQQNSPGGRLRVGVFSADEANEVKRFGGEPLRYLLDYEQIWIALSDLETGQLDLIFVTYATTEYEILRSYPAEYDLRRIYLIVDPPKVAA
jgi:hypothetical protein